MLMLGLHTQIARMDGASVAESITPCLVSIRFFHSCVSHIKSMPPRPY